MGGIVSGIGNAVGNVVGGVGGLASSAVSRIPGIGPIAGPVVGGLTGGPMGFASSLASNALSGNYGGGGGGGGSSGGTSPTPMYAQPNISYGNTTYQSGNNPIDASKYFITGDRGVYNLLPALGQVNIPSRNGLSPILNSRITKEGSYTPYEAYNDIRTQMANDPKALAAFNAAYPTTPYDMQSSRFSGLGRRGVVPFDMNAYTKANPLPYQNVDFGLRGTAVPAAGNMSRLQYEDLAKYAAENKNPFFMPFETTQGATAMGFTPSASALAVDNSLRDYYRNLNSAQYDYYRHAPQLPRSRNEEDIRPGRPNPVAPNPVAPNPVAPNPVAPNPVISRSNENYNSNESDNNYSRPRPVTPPPVASPPVAPPPVTPPPGQFTPMRRGGIAMLKRRK